MSDKIITDFIIEGEKHYGEMFFVEKKILLMTEKLALDLRRRLGKNSEIIVSSLEADESLGNYFHVKENKILALYNHPGIEESARLTKDLKPEMIRNGNGKIIINELVPGELVRGYKSEKNPGWLAVAIYHDFDKLAPKALGWVKDLNGLEGLEKKVFTRPGKLKSLEESVKELLGSPYLIGGRSKKTGYDCSSLAQKIIYDTTGAWLPRKASWQALVGEEIPPKEVRPGDLIFFEEKPSWTVEHVGVVYKILPSENPQIVNASRHFGHVRIQNFQQICELSPSLRLSGYKRIVKFC